MLRIDDIHAFGVIGHETVETFTDLWCNEIRKGGDQMIFTFGNYTVDIDVKKTRQIYKRLPLITQGCNCDGCQNFEKAVDVLPKAVRVFFDDLGIDLKRIVECYVNSKNEDNTLLYGGFCHVCGTLVQGENAWVNISEKHSYYNSDLAYHLDDNFCVSFQDECLMVEDQFEAPILQIEFEASIPWVLNKENTY